MDGYFSITIGEKPYSPEFQTKAQYAAGWKKVLRDAHANHVPGQCQCMGRPLENQRMLSVKHHANRDTFFLAKFADSGPQHHRDCRFYSPNRMCSGYGAYFPPNGKPNDDNEVINDEDGVIRIKVGMGLKVRDTKDGVPALSMIPARERKVDGTAPRVSLLGLMHLLWDKAGYNECNPEKIELRGNPAHRLYKAAEAVRIEKAMLQKHLLVFDHPGTNKEVLTKAKDTRLFVLGPLAREVCGDTLLIDKSAWMPKKMRLIDGLWETTKKRFPLAFSAWQNGGQVITLAQIEPIKNSYEWNVVGMSLMQITDNWIAVESSYEKAVADKLVAEKRKFDKPLRFDARQDAVFPDFILRDTGNPKGTPLEVFGRNDEAYAARQQAKTDYYNEQFGVDGWWCWQPLTGEVMPAFPAVME